MSVIVYIVSAKDGWIVTNYGSGANGYAGWYGYAIDAVQIEVV